MWGRLFALAAISLGDDTSSVLSVVAFAVESPYEEVIMGQVSSRTTAR